jgi:hypothetical protein
MEGVYLHQLGSALPPGYAAPDGAWSVLRHPSAIVMALLTELFQRPIPLTTARSPAGSLGAGPTRACGGRNWPAPSRSVAGSSSRHTTDHKLVQACPENSILFQTPSRPLLFQSGQSALEADFVGPKT